MSDGVLPSALRVAVEGISLHDPVVDTIERKLFLLAGEYRLRNQRRVAIRRLQVLGCVFAVIDILGTLHHHTPVVQRGLLGRLRAHGIG